MVEHQILLENVQPIRRPQYQTLYALRSEMKAQIEKILERGIKRESCSLWSAPDILVTKKSPDGEFRFGVGFRALNSVTKSDPYPLQKFEDYLYCLRVEIFFGARLLTWILAGSYKGRAQRKNRIYSTFRAL